MTRKIITGVIAAVLVVTIAVLAAEKAKEKAEKPQPKAKACERGARMERQEGLLDQLAEAYKANDREKMGKIINKMQERREKIGKLAKLNKWHKWAHRRMMGQMGPGPGRGQQMAGQGWHRGWAMQGRAPMAMNGPRGNRGWAMRGQGPNRGCPMAMAGPRWGQFQAMNGCGQGPCGGMGNCQAMRGPGFADRENMMMRKYQAMADGFRQMPCQQGGMGNCVQQQGGPMQMPGGGRSFQREGTPGPGAGNMRQQEWNTPRRERQNIPPPEWGW